MKSKGYSQEFSAACSAASGTIGLLIPPSITMVLYGVITGTSIGKLFLGGIIPGPDDECCLNGSKLLPGKKETIMEKSLQLR